MSDYSDEDYRFDGQDSTDDCTDSSEEFVHVPPKKKQTKPRQRRPRHAFTDVEEERLKKAIIKYTRDDNTLDWKKIAAAVNPKLPYKSVFQHYKRVTLARKDHKWTRDHNMELLHYVETKGSSQRMADISKEYYDGHFPDNQLRHHYENHVRNNSKLYEDYKRMKTQDIDSIIQRNRKERSTWTKPVDLFKKVTPPKRSLKRRRVIEDESDVEVIEPKEVTPTKRKRSQASRKPKVKQTKKMEVMTKSRDDHSQVLEEQVDTNTPMPIEPSVESPLVESPTVESPIVRSPVFDYPSSMAAFSSPSPVDQSPQLGAEKSPTPSVCSPAVKRTVVQCPSVELHVNVPKLMSPLIIRERNTELPMETKLVHDFQPSDSVPETEDRLPFKKRRCIRKNYVTTSTSTTGFDLLLEAGSQVM
jgi:hypothetical protein